MDVAAADNFRLNLKTAIDVGNLSQNDVAVAARVSRPYVNRVLQGKTVPSIEQCDRLAKAVGFPLIALLADPVAFSESVLSRA
jgi:transcriptional regulator with XRE-family HTH domain